jgi:hypothetical protein
MRPSQLPGDRGKEHANSPIAPAQGVSSLQPNRLDFSDEPRSTETRVAPGWRVEHQVVVCGRSPPPRLRTKLASLHGTDRPGALPGNRPPAGPPRSVCAGIPVRYGRSARAHSRVSLGVFVAGALVYPRAVRRCAGRSANCEVTAARSVRFRPPPNCLWRPPRVLPRATWAVPFPSVVRQAGLADSILVFTQGARNDDLIGLDHRAVPRCFHRVFTRSNSRCPGCRATECPTIGIG